MLPQHRPPKKEMTTAPCNSDLREKQSTARLANRMTMGLLHSLHQPCLQRSFTSKTSAFQSSLFSNAMRLLTYQCATLPSVIAEYFICTMCTYT